MTVSTGFDSRHFRTVLGHFPTGVTVVAALTRGRDPVGLAVGSFTSVSLDPPLVAFLPSRDSRSWPRIRRSGRFCVNVLASDQQELCRLFASGAERKFERVAWTESPGGSPLIDGALAWIDCELHAVHEAGDHFIVLGRVLDLAVERDARPLVFFRGGYEIETSCG